jgi:hypothetical protein
MPAGNFPFSPRGRAASCSRFREAEDDRGAMEAGSQLTSKYGIEIWDQARLVGRVDPTGPSALLP